MNFKRVKLIASEEWKSINRQKVLIYLVFIIVAVLSLAKLSSSGKTSQTGTRTGFRIMGIWFFGINIL